MTGTFARSKLDIAIDSRALLCRVPYRCRSTMQGPQATPTLEATRRRNAAYNDASRQTYTDYNISTQSEHAHWHVLTLSGIRTRSHSLLPGNTFTEPPHTPTLSVEHLIEVHRRSSYAPWLWHLTKCNCPLPLLDLAPKTLSHTPAQSQVDAPGDPTGSPAPNPAPPRLHAHINVDQACPTPTPSIFSHFTPNFRRRTSTTTDERHRTPT